MARRVLLRRENRRRRSVLRRELATYTPGELLDLEAMIERYPLGQTHELRSMLAPNGSSGPGRAHVTPPERIQGSGRGTSCLVEFDQPLRVALVQ